MWKYLLAVLLLNVAPSADAQMCGDCNGDHRVLINELVQAVNNALNNPLEACGLDCTQGSCGAGTCIEFPDDCATSICQDTPKQYAACVQLLHDLTNLCPP